MIGPGHSDDKSIVFLFIFAEVGNESEVGTSVAVGLTVLFLLLVV